MNPRHGRVLRSTDAAAARRTLWTALSAVALAASQWFRALDAALAPVAGARDAWRLALVVALLGFGLLTFRAGLRALAHGALRSNDAGAAEDAGADPRAG